MAMVRISPHPTLRRECLREPITELVNGTFCAGLPQVRLAFDGLLPQFGRIPQKICASLGSYGTLLLTMIKIVLTMTISFAPLTQ
jgi:hypothetical protein